MCRTSPLRKCDSPKQPIMNEEFSNKYATYKRLMADMSQVYDGRKLTSFYYVNIVRGNQRNDISQAINGPLKNVRRAPLHKTSSQDSQGKAVPNETDVTASGDEELLSSTDAISSDSSSRSRSCDRTSTQTSPKTTRPKNEGDKGGKPKAVLRQKYRPRHHNATLNQSISGIMRPTRYSNNIDIHTNDATDATNTDDDNSANSNGEGRMQRRVSMSSMRRRTSLDSCCSSNSFGFSVQSSSDTNNSWVPLGVEFSANMEVLVFEK